MTVGSLFAGIGGFDLGFERAGFEIKWQVEIDPFCRRVLAKHWPHVQRFEDVRECYGYRPDVSGYAGAHFRGSRLEAVDIICGGFPCKQTSRAAAISGRRIGLAGADSGLWRDMLRIVGELQPHVAVVENPESEWLTTVQNDLEELGFGVSRFPVTAAGFGHAHIRRRMFLVAYRDGTRLEERGSAGSSEVAACERLAAQRDARLSALAGVVRVDDGVPGGPYRRQRIGACGNAVIPDAAEWIAQRIKEAEVAA